MIGLMDCNNFFVSCERLFRPDLHKKPVAVLSSNDGCIVARSQEVKAMGVPMGIPYFKVKDLCEREKIVLFSSNFSLYRDISARVMRALKDEDLVCEIYSVDEAFFTLPDDANVRMITDLRSRIMQKTGIPISVGVARTKTLAKLANRVAKDGEGVSILREKDRSAFLETVTCGSVWGVGQQTAMKLEKQGISRVSDFLKLERTAIRSMLGVVGERLYLELSGTSVYKIGDDSHHTQESYTSSRSFGRATHDRAVLLSALLYHTERLAEKLRRDAAEAKAIYVSLRGSRHSTYSHRPGSARRTLMLPTNDTFVLIKVVAELLSEIYDPEIPYKKAGVTFGDIHPARAQASLFENAKSSRRDTAAVSTLLDDINATSGNAIHVATTLYNPLWESKKALRSKAYTTRWAEIPSVKAN